MSLNEKLKHARLSISMTQEAAAEKVGVSRQTISNWENGKCYPDIASIVILSDVYNITLDALLRDDESKKDSGGEEEDDEEEDAAAGAQPIKSVDSSESRKIKVFALLMLFAMNSAYLLIRHFIPISKTANIAFTIMLIAVSVSTLLIAFVSPASQ